MLGGAELQFRFCARVLLFQNLSWIPHINGFDAKNIAFALSLYRKVTFFNISLAINVGFVGDFMRLCCVPQAKETNQINPLFAGMAMAIPSAFSLLARKNYKTLMFVT